MTGIKSRIDETWVARRPLLVLVWLGLAAIGAVGAALAVMALHGSIPGDALGALAADPVQPYEGAALGEPAAYLYSPAFLQLILPIRDAPWFIDAWRVAEAAALIVLAGPFTLLVLLTDQGFWELRQANINFLIGLSLIVAFRFPAAWAFVLLTKVTPGVALLWFAVRREWRYLAIALGVTAVIVAVSAAIAPGAWADWFALLLSQAPRSVDPALDVILPWPLPLRMLLAALLVIWGGRHDQRWTIVVAAVLAMPAIWPNSLTVLVALCSPWLWRRPAMTPEAAPVAS